MKVGGQHLSFDICLKTSTWTYNKNKFYKLIKIFVILNKGKDKTIYVYFIKQKLFGFSPYLKSFYLIK